MLDRSHVQAVGLQEGVLGLEAVELHPAQEAGGTLVR